jgi:hypothetical protein
VAIKAGTGINQPDLLITAPFLTSSSRLLLIVFLALPVISAACDKFT